MRTVERKVVFGELAVLSEKTISLHQEVNQSVTKLFSGCKLFDPKMTSCETSEVG